MILALRGQDLSVLIEPTQIQLMKKLPLFALLISGVTSLFAAERPNILFCISDDQSYQHTGANGDPVIKTPAFDRVSKEGLRFTHAFCDAPTCGPSRSAILTGQSIWRLEEAGNIHSTLPAKFATYTDELRNAGYKVGATGKRGVRADSSRADEPKILQDQSMRVERSSLLFDSCETRTMLAISRTS